MIKFNKILIILLLLIWISPLSAYWNNSNYFIVTAYYSPLPDQKYYLKGSYKAEKKLNWEGIKWSSWKWVFSGMLAAPKWYRFGTKIYLEWLWIWSVEDRGWAIVRAGNRGYKSDRIDVWMWYGDEGLRRALYWGKRKVKWSIISKKSRITLNYKNISAPLWVTKKLKPIVKKNDSIFSTSIWKWSSMKKIKSLQLFLKDLELYSGKIDWIYNEEIVWIIYNFQKENSIIKTEYDYWAGYFWPKTRKAFLKYSNKIVKDRQRREDLIIKYKALEEEAKKEAKKEVIIIWKPKFWEISVRVRWLQKLLGFLWYFNYKDTAIFWKKTEKSIIKFQLDNKIILSEKSKSAWIFWPKTLSVIEEKLKKELLKNKIKEKNLDEKTLLEIWVYEV